MNLAGEDRSASFIAVHVVIAAISLVLAVPVAIIGWRLLRKESALPGRTRRGVRNARLWLGGLLLCWRRSCWR